MTAQSDDVAAIRALIDRQFASLAWSKSAPADWNGFAGDFLNGAPLYPSARPVVPQSVPAFVERMKALADTGMATFHEATLGTDIHVFGNIAIAAAAVEITENQAETSRSVEMMLLVKTGGAWKIAAQAWDKVSASNPIPARLTGAGS